MLHSLFKTQVILSIYILYKLIQIFASFLNFVFLKGLIELAKLEIVYI
jgi:hypothetical protein